MGRAGRVIGYLRHFPFVSKAYVYFFQHISMWWSINQRADINESQVLYKVLGVNQWNTNKQIVHVKIDEHTMCSGSI